MLNKHYTNKVIFLNIETVPQYAKFEEMPDKKKSQFIKRHEKEYHEKTWTLRSTKAGEKERLEICEDLYSRNAALSPEWGKIACISFMVVNDKNEYHVGAIAEVDEKKILEKLLEKVVSIRDWKRDPDSKVVCAYNGFGFTFPFIAKRYCINGLPIPAMFDYAEAKPWEQDQFISLMDIWSFNKSSYTSLAALAECFDIENHDHPEAVAGWYNTEDFKSIKEYSESRVITLTMCYLRIKGITEQLKKATK